MQRALRIAVDRHAAQAVTQHRAFAGRNRLHRIDFSAS